MVIHIGSEVGSLSNQKIHTGIQRVAVELHKHLFIFQNEFGISIHPYISNNDQKSDNYKENKFISQDPVLNLSFKKLDDLDILILIDHNWRTDFGAILKAKQKNPNLKVISLMYDILPINHPEWFEGEAHLISTYFRIYLQKILKIADLVVVNTDKVLNEISQLKWDFKGKFRVIPLGSFEPSLLRVKHPIRTPNTMITVGTIEPRKGQLDLLDAFEILREERFDIRLFIVGNYGWQSEKLIERIYNHPDYGGRLRWFRGISDEELSHLYQISTFSVAPSYDEGFGLNIEESLRHGTPVLARNIEVFSERAQDGIRYFDKDNSDLTKQIRLMCLEEVRVAPNIRSMKDFSKDFLEAVIECANSSN